MATRWACVGPGRIAIDFFHAIRENLAAEDHEFVAVGSSDLSRAQSFAEKFQFKRAYGTYGEVANDQEVEVVYISTLHINHSELSIQMLEAGKHVLCEKPMTMNLAEAKLVFEAARTSKKFFVEGNWSRFFPAYDQIRKELSEGTLGDIRLLQANFGVDLLAWQPSCDPRIGCGGMMAIGCYLTVFATMVFNEMPESIQAKGFLSDVTGKGQVVYISTLHVNHSELAILMLKAGKHVLCEKPVAMNLTEAKLVFEAARESKKLFVEGDWSRFFPVYEQIQKELSDGTLGDIRLAQASFCEAILDWQPVCDPGIGCGGLLTIGSYVTAFATMVFNEMPVSIQAKGRLSDVSGKGPIDVGATILLHYKSGATACLSYEITADGPRTAAIVGTKGFIEVSSPFFAPERVTTPTGSYEFPIKTGDYNYPTSPGLHYEAAAVRQAIIQGITEIERCSWRASEINMAIIDEVHRQIGMRHNSD